MKVSRERFGKEIEKALMSSRNAGMMLDGLVRFGIDSVVFNCEDDDYETLFNASENYMILSPEKRSNTSRILVQRIQAILADREFHCEHTEITTEKLKLLLLFSSFLLPYHGLMRISQGKNRRIKKTPVAFYMLAEGIK